MLELIKDAIENRHLLTIDYDPGEREIEPHALGRSQEGKILLRAFQVAGASRSGEHVNWKLFRIDRMGTVSDSGEEFSGPRSEYNPDDPAMKGGIIARL